MEPPGRCGDWLDTATVTAQGPNLGSTRRGTGDFSPATRGDLPWPPAGTATWPLPGTFSWPWTTPRPAAAEVVPSSWQRRGPFALAGDTQQVRTRLREVLIQKTGRVDTRVCGHRGLSSILSGNSVRRICECRCGAPAGRTTRLGAGDFGVTQPDSGRYGVPWIRLVRRGCRRRPDPPAGLIRSLSARGRDSSQKCRSVTSARPAPTVTAVQEGTRSRCRCWQKPLTRW